jgi:hypothetical protein
MIMCIFDPLSLTNRNNRFSFCNIIMNRGSTTTGMNQCKPLDPFDTEKKCNLQAQFPDFQISNT